MYFIIIHFVQFTCCPILCRRWIYWFLTRKLPARKEKDNIIWATEGRSYRPIEWPWKCVGCCNFLLHIIRLITSIVFSSVCSFLLSSSYSSFKIWISDSPTTITYYCCVVIKVLGYLPTFWQHLEVVRARGGTNEVKNLAAFSPFPPSLSAPLQVALYRCKVLDSRYKYYLYYSYSLTVNNGRHTFGLILILVFWMLLKTKISWFISLYPP